MCYPTRFLPETAVAVRLYNRLAENYFAKDRSVTRAIGPKPNGIYLFNATHPVIKFNIDWSVGCKGENSMYKHRFSFIVSLLSSLHCSTGKRHRPTIRYQI